MYYMGGDVPDNRECVLVLSRVDGTEWPPEFIMQRGNRLCLISLFHAAGITLQIKKHKTEIPDLPGGRAFERTDLQMALAAAMTAHRAGASTWIAGLLIVPEIRTVVGGRSRNPLGLMFSNEAGSNGCGPREGCAIAYRQVHDQPNVYLRTVAHELGHVFNLAHPGSGGEPMEPDAANSLMVPLADLRPSYRLSEAMEFRFSRRDLHWLTNAPEEFVRPGGREFGARPSNWSVFGHPSSNFNAIDS